MGVPKVRYVDDFAIRLETIYEAASICRDALTLFSPFPSCCCCLLLLLFVASAAATFKK
jgi:hypothetical protein